MSSSAWIVLGLAALAGFLAGGAYSTWRRTRPIAILLGAGAALALVAAVFWMR